MHAVFAQEKLGGAEQSAVSPPGSGLGQNNNTATFIGRANQAMKRYGDMFASGQWEPFTSLLADIGARFIRPRPPGDVWQSPYDLDGGERIKRFGDYPAGARPFPYPWAVGCVSGFMPMQDEYSFVFSQARPAWGPGVMTPISVPADVYFPSLPKATG